MKKVFITIALLVGISSLTIANNETKKDSTSESHPEKKVQTLSAEEIELEAELSEEFDISVDSVIEELQEAKEIEEVWVYDIEGNLIQAQSGKIDFALIPINAELLMTEGATQYYIIAN